MNAWRETRVRPYGARSRMAMGPVGSRSTFHGCPRSGQEKRVMKKRSEKLSLAVAAALGLYGMGSQAQAVVSYFDNFDRLSLNGGTYAYSTTTVTSDGGAEIGATWNGNVMQPNLLSLNNDTTGPALNNSNGYVYTTTPTSAYTGFTNTISTTPGGDVLT